VNYYNEFDPYAAAWLRNLISEKLIPYGVVDERSIEDVAPSDLAGFTQCHFFAGIAGWSLALALAGFPDNYPIWTGSCPCQPFSTAGEGKGFDDERHLWPAFHWLIQQCRPARVVGEQVAAKIADPWIDLVRTDLEALGFAFGAVAFPSASVGAPHIRDRTYWLGDTDHARLEGRGEYGCGRSHEQPVGPHGVVDRMADHDRYRQPSTPIIRLPNSQHHAQSRGLAVRLEYPEGIGRIERWPESSGRGIDPGCAPGSVADTASQRRQMALQQRDTSRAAAVFGEANVIGGMGAPDRAGPTNGYWSAVDWLACRDGKWRPV
jgi:DNA (cytosine-5)-methyltransferase 1